MRDNRHVHALIALDGKGYVLIRTYALINTGVKQQLIMAMLALINKNNLMLLN